MSLLDRKRIRILGDQSLRTNDSLTDILASSSPEMFRGNDVQFEIGIGVSGLLQIDISNIATLTLEVKPSADKRTDAPLMSKSIPSSELKQDLTQQLWNENDPANAHGLVTFTGTETNINLGGAFELDTWLVLSVTTNDAPGHDITLGRSIFKIVEDGTGSAEDPPNFGQNFYDKVTSDARFMQRHEDNSWVQFAQGRFFYFIQETGLWYAEIAIVVDGIPTKTLDQNGVVNP